MLRTAVVALEEPLILLAALAAVFGAAALSRLAPAARLAGAAALVFGALLAWDDASTYERALGRAEPQASLRDAAGPGEVLWPTGTVEPWFWMRQPNWASAIQGASVVFSAEQAASYRERAGFLNDHGFDNGLLLHPTKSPFSAPEPDEAAFKALCARRDAPGSVVMPRRPGMSPPGEWRARLVWRAPAPHVEPPHDAKTEPFRADDYAVVRCADHK